VSRYVRTVVVLPVWKAFREKRWKKIVFINGSFKVLPNFPFQNNCQSPVITSGNMREMCHLEVPGKPLGFAFLL
jgi:hypothetical protein